MTNDDPRDSVGNLVRIEQYGGEICIRSESVTDPADYVQIRFPAKGAVDVAYQLLAAAARVQGAFPPERGRDE